MGDIIYRILADLFKAWRAGSVRLRFFIRLAIGLVFLALVVLLLGYSRLVLTPWLAEQIAGVLGALAALIALAISALQTSLQQVEQDKRIELVERRVQEHPGETQASWELARVKLERYVDRNLSQVRSIFMLTTLVMLAGFSLIVYGVINGYRYPANFNASVLAAISGIVVNFIGASFLVIYRSTMNQAKDFVTMLERINAVGMAVQILEKIEDQDGKLRSETTSALAKQLLVLYTPVKHRRG